MKKERMFMKKFPVLTLLFLLLGTLVLVACGSPAEVQDAVEDVVNEVAPTVQAAVEEIAPTVEAAVEEVAPTVEAAATEVAEVVEEPTAEPTEEPAPELRTDNLEGETITFYHFGDLSGPLAGITGPLINGFNDAVAAVNANGGIRGAQIEIQFSDTQSSVDEAVAAYDRYTSENDNVLVMFTYGSGDGEALASRFVEDGIPNLAAGLSSVAFYGPESGYTFGYAPIYPDQFGLFMDYISANWDDVKPAGAGDDIKIAYISWPTAYGQGAYTDEALAYAESLGIEIVANEIIDVSPTADTTTAILTAQAEGANVIYTNSLAFGPGSILTGLGALGLRDEFLFGANNWAMDLSVYAFVSDPALVEGMISPFPYLFWSDEDNAGIQFAAEQFAANDRQPGERGVGYLLTFAGVDLAVRAIELAIDNVGFDALTGADVQAALIELGAIDVLDGVMRIDYSNDSRSPHQAQLRQVQGGQFVVLQDWTDTPDMRPEVNFANP
jgi:branched-chain amino acid transport system substrate-binding protein